MSILDYKRDTLSKDIWDNSNKIKPGVKDFIYKSLEQFFISQEIKGYSDFISYIFIGSSLATYYYTDDSDLDVKVVLDINSFIAHNTKYTNSDNDLILEELIDNGRNSSWLTSFIPGTTHVLDVYFIDINDFNYDRLIRYDSLYSLVDDKWIKEPASFVIDKSPNYVLNLAKSKADVYLNKLDLDIGKAKRDTIDFNILIDFLKTLDQDDIDSYKDEVIKSLDTLNKSIGELVNDRVLFKAMRKNTFDKKKLDEEFEKKMNSINYSDRNLIYKVLQRYGYLRILYEISKLYNDGKITIDEVDDISDIILKT